MKNIDDMIAVMQAHKEGREIQVREKSSSSNEEEWYDIRRPAWDWYSNDYRVKQEEPVPGKPDTFLTDNNPKTRVGAMKVPLHLVSPVATFHEACAMADGAKKYGPFNWREENVSVSTYIAAALRHIYAYLDGQEVADDSGAHHLGHARACLGIILDADASGTLIDDRPPPANVQELFDYYHNKRSGATKED